MTKLLGYDFDILYQLGLNNKAAGALPRLPHKVELMSLIALPLVDMEVLLQEVQEDEELKKLIETLEKESASILKFLLEQGRIFYRGRLVISQNSQCILALLQTFLDSVLGGHSGICALTDECLGSYIGRA